MGVATMFSWINIVQGALALGSGILQDIGGFFNCFK